MFNKFKYRKTLKMIAHFDTLIADVAANRDDYYGWQANGAPGLIGRFDTSDPKLQKSLKKVDDWLAKLIRMAPLPKQNDAENAQMQELLDEKWNSEKLTRPELLALIRKYPPEILEAVLPCVMVMYLLRETDLEFDSDTKTFEKFFDGWHHMVIRC